MITTVILEGNPISKEELAICLNDHNIVSVKLDFQDRVREERDELGKKIKRLNAFLVSQMGIPMAERNRLDRQYNLMVEYRRVLSERIDAWQE